jgi:hypothetical protein
VSDTARIIDTPDGPVLDMPCPKYGRCFPAPAVRREPAGDVPGVGRFWQWIGPADAPTITPSVGCDSKCGQHRVITNGRWTGGAA